MTRDKLKQLLDLYQDAEDEIIKIDDTTKMEIRTSKHNNFYNKYNYIIFQLFGIIFGDNKEALIEQYIFDDNSDEHIDFDELCKRLEI